MSGDARADGTRAAIARALLALDDEAFAFAVVTLEQLARERGGFLDKAGLQQLELAAVAWIREQGHPNGRRADGQTAAHVDGDAERIPRPGDVGVD